MPDGVLITRPEPGAGDTAKLVAALGYQPIVAPLLQIRPLRTALPPSAHVQAILVTSGNAIPLLPPSHHHLPLLAVGDATAARARSAGFVQVSSAAGDATALAAMVAQSCRRGAGPLLLACGRDQGTALAATLRAQGFAVVRRVIYAAAPATDIPAAARKALTSGDVEAALFFSADTARCCVELLRAGRLHDAVRAVDALAISERTAVALQPLTWRRIRVAIQPNQDAMLALLR